MKKYFFYKVYGLNVRSEIEIRELISLNYDEIENIQVEIFLKDIDYEIRKKIDDRIMQGYSSNNMWFSINDIGTFNVIDGKKIIVDLVEKYDLSMFKIYLLGVAFAMLKIQREEIAMHGASIEINNRGILILGESGAGKSTLTTEFRMKGYKLLSDDMSSLEINKNKILINPSFPMQRIGTDLIEYFNYDENDYNKIQLNREKLLVPIEEEFQCNNVELSSIFYLKQGDVKEVQLEEIHGSQKIDIIINSIFRAAIFNEIKMTPAYLRKCLFIAKNTNMYNLIRPKDIISSSDQADKVLEKINNL